MEWVDGNLGSRLTMKYPAVYMMGKGARGEILSIAFAGKGQHQDAGGKVVHGAPYTSSRIISKSISKNGGRASYRGLLKVAAGAKGSKSNVVCDALILDAAEPVGHVSVHRDRRGRRQDRPRGQRLQDRRGAALLPDEPRALRGRGLDPDRQRVHRAAGQGAADGVRRRDEQADPAPDGRVGGVSGRRRVTGTATPMMRRMRCRSTRPTNSTRHRRDQEDVERSLVAPAGSRPASSRSRTICLSRSTGSTSTSRWGYLPSWRGSTVTRPSLGPGFGWRRRLTAIPTCSCFATKPRRLGICGNTVRATAEPMQPRKTVSGTRFPVELSHAVRQGR